MSAVGSLDLARDSRRKQGAYQKRATKRACEKMHLREKERARERARERGHAHKVMCWDVGHSLCW